MNYWFIVIPALTSAVASGAVFFWVGHEHGVRSATAYLKRRNEYLEGKSSALSGNVRLVYGSDKRSS